MANKLMFLSVVACTLFLLAIIIICSTYLIGNS